ncbi:MAG: cation-translocating P-type ATPase [Chloroflexota bacterium]
MPEYFRLSADDALSDLQVDASRGLPPDEVKKRREQHGSNALPKDEGVNWVQLILGQFTDVMVIILIIAAVISFFLGERADVIVILVIVVLNAVLGIYQEYRAEQALAALGAMQVPLVMVRRDGEVRQISAEDLVPGDIVLLEEGSSVPADGRLLTSVNLQVEEAALTGESAPVTKSAEPIDTKEKVAVADRQNMVFMGTAVNYGRGEMVVTETGLSTELGNIATLLLQVEDEMTPLQRRLNTLGKTLAAGAGLVVLIVFIAGVLRGYEIQQMFLVAVSLAVAAVPEGLPALVAIGLSLGAARMVRRNALIRRLPAVETLGSVTVICSDKTGTLTRNEMTATHLVLPAHGDVEVTGIGYTPEGDFFDEEHKLINPREDELVGRFLKAMALSTNAYIEEVEGEGRFSVVGDTTEGALLVAAQKAGWTRDRLEQDMPRRAELPFSSERKSMTTVHEVIGEEARSLFPDSEVIAITKGAPDRLIEWATREHLPDGPRDLADERRVRWQSEVEEMASQGLRVLGVAYRPLDAVPDELDEDIERELVLLGLVGIVDPARPEAKDAVEVARRAGIRSLMITGDHALTAEAIARNLGIIENGQRAVTGRQLDEMDDAALLDALSKTSAFARVSPEHKLRIVRVLKTQGQVVAMTGDGVNDAPALKQADIGVAMGITGTDVSKGASKMVLTDDNFASIVSAVEEGRTIYDNIRKFIKYLLSSNVGEILVMFVALMVGLKIPLLAIQILWINLVTDGLPAIALGFEGTEEGVMDRPPRPVNQSIFAEGVGGHIIRIGILIAILTLGGFIWGFTSNGMDPLDPTLGIESFEREAVVALMDRSGADVNVPETWDAWTEPMREAYLNEADVFAEELDGLADLSRVQIVELSRTEGLIPDDWDALTVADREAFIVVQAEEAEEDEGEGILEEEGSAGILSAAERIPRTIAFTILAFTQMFEVMAIHAGDRISFFRKGFGLNKLLLWAVLSTFVLQLIVVYVPSMQAVFRTAPLGGLELLVTAVAGSVILLAVELEKVYIRRTGEVESDRPHSAWRGG